MVVRALNNLADEHVTLGETPQRQQAELWALVLLSADIPTSIELQAGNYVLRVSSSLAARAAMELEFFEKENRNWPPFKDMPLPAQAIGERPPTVLMMGSLVIFHMVTGPFVSGSEWFRHGAVNSRAVLEGGEWWRLLTALTLHSDPVHLFSNVFIGGLVIHFLCKMSGTGLAWLMLMLAGTVANYANVVARGAGHISVGFSTAVFAAVGLLCGGQVSRMNWRSVLLPLGAGVAMLAMLGSAGKRTDLGAHLWGLVVGFLFGLAWRWLGKNIRFDSRGFKQTCFLAVTLISVWLAWVKALAG